MNYLDKTGLSHLWSKITTKLGQKQDTLVSGTNIKTINNQSILGSGNISISGGGGGSATDVQINGTSITSNGVADIATGSSYDENNNPIATTSDVYSIIDEVASSQEFTQQLIQIITALMPSGAEVSVSTYEDLPASATEYSKAYVQEASLYDVVNLIDIQFDFSLVSHLSPVPATEMDFTGWNAVSDYFTIDYIDYLGYEWTVSCNYLYGAWVILIGSTVLESDSDTIYVYADNNLDFLGITSAGWYYLRFDLGLAVPITFNEAPIISTINGNVIDQQGNILRTAELFVGAKKHYAGEYRFVNGQWVYQGTPITQFIDTSPSNVPSSNVLYKTIDMVASVLDGFDATINEIYEIIGNLGGE